MERPFAGQGSDFAFDAQDITITVPASFDAAAQRLTLAAAQQAGFPIMYVCSRSRRRRSTGGWSTRLAAAIRGAHCKSANRRAPCFGDRRRGGTSDFSLFELSRHGGSRDPGIKRVAVSDHILLGAIISISRSRICWNHASRRGRADFPLGSGIIWSPGAGLLRKGCWVRCRAG